MPPGFLPALYPRPFRFAQYPTLNTIYVSSRPCYDAPSSPLLLCRCWWIVTHTSQRIALPWAPGCPTCIATTSMLRMPDSATVIATSSGSKIAELRYHPWGGTRFSSGTTPTARRYTGQIEDAAIGLYFYNARYYDPALGRFIQADTIIPDPANPQSLNRYAYVLNNPLRYTDPSGHAYCPPEANGRCIDEHEPPPPRSISQTSRFSRTPALYFFRRLPLEPTNSLASQWFGATDFAYKYGGTWNYDGYCQGYHCGIDIGRMPSEYGTSVYAGLYGTVESVAPTYGAGKHAVNIRVGRYVFVYGIWMVLLL